MRLHPASSRARFGAPRPETVAPRAAQARTARRLMLVLALMLCGALLTGCATLNALVSATPAADTGVTGPNLGLISLPAYDDQEAEGPAATDGGSGYANVDLWLDATQNMGGISTTSSSMYPHYGHKYREGGFQYHYGSTAGWYESLLRDFLAAAGETHVRTLRYGNETMSDDFLAAYGLASADAETAASVWRDLHTTQIDTTAGLFSQLSAENMENSFYDLGSVNWLNRMPALSASDLENPSLYEAMNTALDAQTDGIADGDESLILSQGRNGEQCALLNALANIDTDKLSVITVDPASVRKTAGADAQGQPVAYYEQLLEELGVFDKGLCLGILDFQLDYMGQMSTVSTAALSEPLAWGHLILDDKKQTGDSLGVLPRRMLTLVIGTRARVDGFIGSLSSAIDADASLRGLRGVASDELAYTADGETVITEPFGFEWNATVVARPSVGYYSQHTDGASIAADDDSAVKAGENGVALISLSPDAGGQQPDRTVTVRFPLAANADGAELDVNGLSDAGVSTLATVLLSQTLQNTPENLAAAEAGGQEAVAYRDKLYLFSRETDDGGAFTLNSIGVDDGELVVSVAVDGGALKPGYYRLRLTADATADQVAWESVPWIDGSQSVSASVTDADVYAWETFTAAITKYDRDAKGLPKMFRNAWGPYTDTLYHGLTVPDCPPVYQSIHLKELADQFRSAAAADRSALLRYVFEVFVAYP